MFIPGHLSIGVLLLRRFGVATRGWAWVWGVLAGTLLPDLLDKTLWLLDVYPWSRTVGHSLVMSVTLGATAALLHRSAGSTESRRTAGWLMTGLLVGQLTHLAADFVADIEHGALYTGYMFSAWFGWPFSNADQLPLRCHPVFGMPRWPATTELIVSALAFVQARRAWRLRDAEPSDGQAQA